MLQIDTIVQTSPNKTILKTQSDFMPRGFRVIKKISIHYA